MRRYLLQLFLEMISTARKLTLSALLTALTISFLFLSNILPTGRIGVIAVASLFVTAAVIEVGLGSGAFVFAGSAILAALLLPEKSSALIFALFFGYYPIIKSLAERLKNVVLTWIVKVATFNASLTVIWFLFKEIFFDSDLISLNVFIIYALGNIIFVLYDIGLKRLISFYIVRISKKLKKDRTNR